MKKILIATKNAHKVREFKEILEPMGYEVLSLLDIKEKLEIEENGTTFEENAIIKAKAIHALYKCEVISDDSGICIDYFDGKPGVYSSRWLGEDTPYEIKNAYILKEVGESKNRGARYVCAIAHVLEDGTTNVYTGVCEGEIAYKAEGSKGFGYDPIFYYPSYGKTLAMVSEEEKNAISHRGNAIVKLLEGMKKK